MFHLTLLLPFFETTPSVLFVAAPTPPLLHSSPSPSLKQLGVLYIFYYF
jgi:hypothetical protein